MEDDSAVIARLVARARAKAIRRGTTLESEVESWLKRYVDAPDFATGDDLKSLWDQDAPIHAKPPEASRAFTARSTARSKPGSASPSSSGATRSEAYRRLMGVLRDEPDRSS